MDANLKAKVEELKQTTDVFLNKATPEQIAAYKEMLEKLREKANQDSNSSTLADNPFSGLGNSGQTNGSGNKSNGKVKVQAIPGVKKWFEDDSGFSRYIVLAGLAFVIQFIVTLVCIFFYK